ncbi:MAG: ATP-binding protein [Sphaerochaetaceae bacterium]|nr:ATP-binding protein [Sphaerochaetaceae bacterium]
MIIPRNLSSKLISSSKLFPIVTLTGPRQSGKTTLVKACFPQYTYCNLENPEIRAMANNDPKTFFHIHKTPMIIDEVQRVPELLSWVQVLSDDNPKHGQYILTGSNQLQINEAISQSLAGRTAIFNLLPLSISEIQEYYPERQEKETMIVNGFLPRLHNAGIPANLLYSNYFSTYIERDVRLLTNIKNLTQFENFIRLLAGRIGQVVNLSSLSNDVGVSSTTLANWLSILEASFIIYRLPPYHSNMRKRITKSPKLYFVETGLAAWLLGIETPEQCIRDPLFGKIFENMVVMDLIKQRVNKGYDPRLFFYRDAKGHEVDLIFDQQRVPYPIEIKSAMTWNDQFSKGIKWFQSANESSGKGAVVYSGDIEFDRETYVVRNYHSDILTQFELNG